MPDQFWMKKKLAADLLDITERYFDETVRKQLSPGEFRGERKALEFFAPAVVRVWLQMKVAKLAKLEEPDPLMRGGIDSPALERYRNANADLREMERDRQRKSLVKVEEMEPGLMRLADVLRSAGDLLVRQFGNDAGAIINEAIDEYEAGLKATFGDEGDLRRGGDDGEGVLA